MNKEENTVNFDLSVLTLNELIDLYEKVTGFIQFLNEQKKEDKGEK